jgi:hypothetical protein
MKRKRAGERVTDAVGDGVGELIFAVLGCLTLVGATALFRWGWSTSPTGTALVTGAVICAVGLAAAAWWQRRKQARAAAGWIVAILTAAGVTAMLLIYGAAYCSDCA